jgi:hypothetical protein
MVFFREFSKGFFWLAMGREGQETYLRLPAMVSFSSFDLHVTCISRENFNLNLQEYLTELTVLVKNC